MAIPPPVVTKPEFSRLQQIIKKGRDRPHRAATVPQYILKITAMIHKLFPHSLYSTLLKGKTPAKVETAAFLTRPNDSLLEHGLTVPC